jgi:hypothetical protein
MARGHRRVEIIGIHSFTAYSSNKPNKDPPAEPKLRMRKLRCFLWHGQGLAGHAEPFRGRRALRKEGNLERE